MFNNDSMKENLDSIDQAQQVRRGTDYNSPSSTMPNNGNGSASAAGGTLVSDMIQLASF